MGAGAAAAGAGVALVGGALYLGGTTDPIEAERRLNLTRQQQRSGANLTPQDGDAEGRPINLTGVVKLGEHQVGTFLGNSLAKGASGPSGGTTGFDVRAGTAGGMMALP